MPVTGDVIRCDVEGDFNGVDRIINSFHVQIGTSAPTTDASLLTDLRDLFEAFMNLMDGFYALETVFRRIRAVNRSTGLALGIESFVSPVPGTATSQTSATGVALLASGRLSNSNAQLRKYFGPLAEGAISVDALITSGTAGVALTALATITGPLVVNTHDYRVGYPVGGLVGNFQNVEGWFVSSVPAYQRRRKQGRGA